MEKAQIGPVLWLVAFVGSGIGLGQTFELLQLHAGPARYDTFFLCLLGYWTNFLVGGLWVVWTGSWRRGRWTRRMRAVLVLSAVFDGAAQALKHCAEALRLDPDHSSARKMRLQIKELEALKAGGNGAFSAGSRIAVRPAHRLRLLDLAPVGLGFAAVTAQCSRRRSPARCR